MLQTTVDEERFVAEKLSVPPPLPRILKEFTKAAIRTQPYDLLRWSVSYFQALADGEEPPVKDRLEFPPLESQSGLTPGYLKVLHKQLGGHEAIPAGLLARKWSALCLKDSALTEMLALMGVTLRVNTPELTSEQGGEDESDVIWSHFLLVAAGYITQSPLQTMVQMCETLTHEPEGASACIPFSTFEPLYRLISGLHAPHVTGIGPTLDRTAQNAVLDHLKSVAEEQGGNITPRNLAHFTCPKLY